MHTPDIKRLLETIERQSQEIALLKSRIQDLEKRLNKDSSNSSRPPSSDGFESRPSPYHYESKAGVAQEAKKVTAEKRSSK